jgi:nucleoside-diphosphate kinase
MTQYIERTLVLLKPDAVVRGLAGDVLTRFQQAGFTIIGLKLLQPSLEHARTHYPTTDVQLRQMGAKTLSTYAELGIDPIGVLGTDDARVIGAMVHEWNAEFLASGPVIACVVKGVHAVKKVRAICGSTMPRDAAPGTIRGDYSSASPAVANMLKSAVYNLVHASDNENDPGEPENEIAHWFRPEELVDYEITDVVAMFKGEISR